eukprot:4615203-Amphidinium_carterae.1
MPECHAIGTAFTDQSRADTLAKHFAGVSRRKPKDSLAHRGMARDLKRYLKEHPSCDPAFPGYSFQQVRSAVKSLLPGKSPGHDLICAEFLHHLPRVALSALRDLYTHCRRTCYIPRLWRRSRYWSELYALYSGLLSVLHAGIRLNGENILLVSDSQSALKSVASTSSQTHEVLCSLLNTCAKLGCASLFLLYVPAHQGIERNEQCDVLAKASVCTPLHPLPLPLDSFVGIARSFLTDIWEAEQHDDQTLQATYALYMQCRNLIRGFASRHEQCRRYLPWWLARVLSQLRANRSSLFTNFELLQDTEEAQSGDRFCPNCGAIDSLAHLVACQQIRPILDQLGLQEDPYTLLHREGPIILMSLLLSNRLSLNSTTLTPSPKPMRGHTRLLPVGWDRLSAFVGTSVWSRAQVIAIACQIRLLSDSFFELGKNTQTTTTRRRSSVCAGDAVEVSAAAASS